MIIRLGGLNIVHFVDVSVNVDSFSAVVSAGVIVSVDVVVFSVDVSAVVIVVSVVVSVGAVLVSVGFSYLILSVLLAFTFSIILSLFFS